MDRGGCGLKRVCTVLMFLGLGTGALAATGSADLEPAGNDVDNTASLQRGARNFMNYCAGCHSAKHVRYNSIARDLELSEDEVIENLMFNAEKIFGTIRASMPADDAERWFGKAPPDMSLMARAKGTDYIYNFLRGFYLDKQSPTGVDNVFLAGTSMPHVLWELQGFQDAVFETSGGGDASLHFERFEAVTAGSMSAEQFDGFVRDTVNFLEYISEPVRSTRRVMGVWVLMYLIFFFIVALMLKKQIWKDVS